MAELFINSRADVVPDLMPGLYLDSSRVTLFDPASGHNFTILVSLPDNKKTTSVSFVSVVDSGHEPMASGCVWDGMMDVTVAGNFFVSTSVSDISSMLHAISQRSTGIFMVFMDYQGDLHNFFMAKKDLLPKITCYPIHMMLFSCDFGLPNAIYKRSISVSIFGLKLSGSAADHDHPFQDIVNISEMESLSTVIYNVALEPFTIPGHYVDKERLTEY